MTTNTPLTLTTEAREWLAAHKGWSAGIPTEIVGLKLQGQDTLRAYKEGKQHTPGSCPNTFRPWYRDGFTTKVGAGAPLGQIIKGMSKDGAGNEPTLTKNTTYRTPLADHYQDEELPAFVNAPVYTEAQVFTPATRNTYYEAQADTKVLSDTTWTTYTKNTKTLWAAKGIHSSRKYEIKVQQLDMQLRTALANHNRRTYGVVVSNTDMATDKAVDHTDANIHSLLELTEVLKETLTARQLQLLEDKAFGTPVRGSSYKQLVAAQKKARVALKGLLTNR